MFPNNSTTWIEYAEFEGQLEEFDRARAIYEFAITRTIDMPENLWKSYIDMEISQSNFNRVRDLYSKLLAKTKHVKVWLSFTRFESDTALDPQRARVAFN